MIRVSTTRSCSVIRDDAAENVIYLGSFSKTFAPGLRVGWVLAPHAVREKLVLANESATLDPPVFNQMMVSRYLATFDWQSDNQRPTGTPTPSGATR